MRAQIRTWIDKIVRHALNARKNPRPIVKFSAAWLVTCYPTWNFLHVGKAMLAAFVLFGVIVAVRYVGLSLRIVPRVKPQSQQLHEQINDR